MHAPINIDFWTEFYRTGEDPDSTYHEALEANRGVINRAEALWDWKDLSRGVSFEKIQRTLETLQMEQFTSIEPSEAVSSLGRRLVESGAMSNATVVTPAFLLHLAKSERGQYSMDFPIFDARVWVAYVYLTGYRTGDDRLPVAATSSATKYGEYVDFFRETIPSGVGGRRYERALFRFGGYIDSLPVESISDIDAHLSTLEQSLSTYQRETGKGLGLDF